MGKRARATRPEEVARQLDALYAELPSIACKGKCWKCCGQVLMTPRERERVHDERGVELPTVPEMQHQHRELCPALRNHRCTVYEVRPLMCRLWGVLETMRCPYGCVPEGGWLTEEEGGLFWYRACLIAGWPVEEQPQLNPAQVAAKLREHKAKLARHPGGRPPRIQPEEPSTRSAWRRRFGKR